jgi:hemin uptake protein HemP
MKQEPQSSATHPAEEPSASDTPEPRVWRSEQILGEAKEVLIVHGGETYRLRRTRLGKLILQK